MSFIEFDTLANLMKFIESEDNEAISGGMKALGCKNINVQIWNASKVYPDPITAPGG
jgi:hypothetical protein